MRTSLAAPATVAAILGPLVYLTSAGLHPSGVEPNDLPAVFAQYAASTGWTATHLGELVGLLLVLLGLAGIAATIRGGQAGPVAEARGFGGFAAAVGIGVALMLVPIVVILQAVDAVALKRAVDGWVAAGADPASATFGAAAAVRHLEEALNASVRFGLGIEAIALGGAILVTAGLPRVMGLVALVLGGAIIVSAGLVAGGGFSPAAQDWGRARTALWLWTLFVGLVMLRRIARKSMDEGRTDHEIRVSA